MKSIKPEEFLKLVSANSGIDLETSKRVYYGMLRTITRELKKNRIITLPDLGDFYIKMFKEKAIIDYQTKQRKMIPTTPVVKFKPDYKVKAYFHDLGAEGTMI
jgi:nucleoid DNA-binding protein